MGELKDILLNFGAIAGFAGIIGLAVLAMLYFSQARDVRRLREWAGREPERAAEVELRAQQIASAAISQAYESMAYRQSEAAAAQGIAEEAGVDLPPPPQTGEGLETEVQPALGEEQPALSQETQAHDVVAEEFGGVAEGEQPAESDVAVPPVPTADVQAAAASEHTVSLPPPDQQSAEQQSAETGSVEVPAVEPPDTSAEPPAEPPAPVLPTPSTPAAARTAGPLPPLPPLDTSEFGAVQRPALPQIPDSYLSTGTTASEQFEAIDPGSDRRSRVPFAVAGVLVAVFAVILISTQLLGGGETDNKAGTGGSATNRPAENTADRDQRINRAAVTVSVLNGTSTEGLARGAADGLNKAGFTDTTTGNLPNNNTEAATIVYYAQGSRPEAQEVANELAVKTLKPATNEILAAGGSVPVIVVLGADFQQ